MHVHGSLTRCGIMRYDVMKDSIREDKWLRVGEL